MRSNGSRDQKGKRTYKALYRSDRLSLRQIMLQGVFVLGRMNKNSESKLCLIQSTR